MKFQRAILIALVFLIGITAQAQQPVKACATNKNSPPPNTWHWPEGTHVKVYLMRGMFKPADQQAIREVIDQWNSLSEHVGAGIKYDFEGEVDQAKDSIGFLTLTRIEIMKGTNNKLYAYFFPTRNTDGLIHSAIITFDFNTTDAAALKSYVSHEMGHGMGLWDCKSCEGKSTIMKGFPGVNKGNGLVAPTTCDLHVVKSVFNQGRKLAKLAND